jgi:hypothetical protein
MPRERSYSEYLAASNAEELDAVHRTQVYRDVPRTFPQHPRFAVKEAPQNVLGAATAEAAAAARLRLDWVPLPGPDSLVPALANVLMAAVALDPDAGYTQGMNYIVATLLLSHGEEGAFDRLARLMDQFPGLYSRGGAADSLYSATRLECGTLEAMLSLTPVGKHLQQAAPGLLEMCSGDWFVPLFTKSLEADDGLQVLEYLLEPDASCSSPAHRLTRLALAMFKTQEKRLLASHSIDVLHPLVGSLPSIAAAAGIQALLSLADDPVLATEASLSKERHSVALRVEEEVREMETRERVMATFKEIDTDHSRSLNFAEFRSLLRDQGVAAGAELEGDALLLQTSSSLDSASTVDKVARALFEAVDRNGDGAVTFRELEASARSIGHFTLPADSVDDPAEGAGLHRCATTANWTRSMFGLVDKVSDPP